MSTFNSFFTFLRECWTLFPSPVQALIIGCFSLMLLLLILKMFL